MIETKIIVRYFETDQMGIAHHSMYAVWYEVARTELIKKIGITYSKMEEMGAMTPLVELNSKYIKPVYYEDELIIKVRVSKLTPARIIFSYEIYCKEQLVNTGYTVHAWVGKQLKPLNMKKNFPEIYTKIQEMVEENIK